MLDFEKFGFRAQQSRGGAGGGSASRAASGRGGLIGRARSAIGRAVSGARRIFQR